MGEWLCGYLCGIGLLLAHLWLSRNDREKWKSLCDRALKIIREQEAEIESLRDSADWWKNN